MHLNERSPENEKVKHRKFLEYTDTYLYIVIFITINPDIQQRYGTLLVNKFAGYEICSDGLFYFNDRREKTYNLSPYTAVIDKSFEALY